MKTKNYLFSYALILIFLTAHVSIAQNVIWAKQYGDTFSDRGSSIFLNKSGELFTMGVFSETLSLGTTTLVSAGGSDFCIAKNDPLNGSVIWAQRYGGAADEFLGDIVADESGHFYAIGSFVNGDMVLPSYTLTNAGSVDICVFKIHAASNNVVWAKGFGGAGYDQGFSIFLDQAGDVFICGSFSATATFDSFTLTPAGKWDVFAARLDPGNGNVQWIQPVGGPNDEIGTSICDGRDGTIYITGGFRDDLAIGSSSLTSAGPGNDVYLARLSKQNGSPLWAKRYGGPNHEEGFHAYVSKSGELFSTGQFHINSMFDTYTLAPSTAFSPGYLMKIDSSNGAVIWVRDIGKSGFVAEYPDGDLSIAAGFHQTVPFGSATLTAVGSATSNNQDIAIVKISPVNGNIVSVNQLGGGAEEAPSAHFVDSIGQLYITGSFRGATSYGTFSFTSAPGDATPSDIFVMKLSGPTATITNIENVIKADEIQLFPNPVTNDLNVAVQAGSGPAQLIMFNYLGQVVRTQRLEFPQTTMDVSGLNPGMYTVIVSWLSRTSAPLRIIRAAVH